MHFFNFNTQFNFYLHPEKALSIVGTIWISSWFLSLSLPLAILFCCVLNSCIVSLNNWICWLLMISKWHSMDYIEFQFLVWIFFVHRKQTKKFFRFNNSNRKRMLFIDIKAMMWLSTPSMKAPSSMSIWKPGNPLISHTVDILLMKFWCCGHFAHLALNLSE